MKKINSITAETRTQLYYIPAFTSELLQQRNVSSLRSLLCFQTDSVSADACTEKCGFLSELIKLYDSFMVLISLSLLNR